MLSAPSKNLRVKTAVALAAAYLLCILAPAAALAFSGHPSLVHCLTEGHVGLHLQDDGDHHHAGATAHDHHAAAAHDHHHDAASQPRSHDRNALPDCCGLFSVVALAGDPDLALGPSGHASMLVPAPRQALSGRGPERLYRPPISLLSL